MSIFGIAGLGILIGLLLVLIALLPFIADWWDSDSKWVVPFLIGVFVITLVISLLVGIGLVTEDERIFVSKYEMQKTTIETSLNSDVVSGLERIELVNKAVELNGELAERKARCDRWHHILYDNHIYDNVEFIKFD